MGMVMKGCVCEVGVVIMGCLRWVWSYVFSH